MVTKNGMVFKCNAGHYSLFCPMGAYEPLSAAHGDAYKLAWSSALVPLHHLLQFQHCTTVGAALENFSAHKQKKGLVPRTQEK